MRPYAKKNWGLHSTYPQTTAKEQGVWVERNELRTWTSEKIHVISHIQCILAFFLNETVSLPELEVPLTLMNLTCQPSQWRFSKSWSIDAKRSVESACRHLQMTSPSINHPRARWNTKGVNWIAFADVKSNPTTKQKQCLLILYASIE